MTQQSSHAPSKPAATEHWSGRIGIILAVAGSAVGLGNFLRFPGQAVEYGGGAFMIPYFLSLLLLGIPIGWAEWTMGKMGGLRGFHGAPGVLGYVGRSGIARYLGALGVLVPLIVYMYYVLIEAWCLRYAWSYLTGSLDLGAAPDRVAASQAFFSTVSGDAANGSLLQGDMAGVWFWLVVFAANVWLVRRGLSGGIEIFCRWAMPAMALCAVVVLIRVLTLGTPDPSVPERNVITALGFMWNPDLSKLADFETWLAAAGQVFFSLSVGFGVIINYASYLKKDDDVVLSSLTAAATNEVFEVSFGGLITITAAFIFLGASGATGGTFGLGFQTLPVVFSHMDMWERIIGFTWFFMLFLAAITSSLSMLQPVKAFLQEALGLSSERTLALLTAVTLLGSAYVGYMSENLVALDTMDFWVGTCAIFIVAGVQVVCFSWVLGVDAGFTEAHRGALMKIPRFYRFILKYIAPTFLLVVFIGFCANNLPTKIEEIGHSPVAKWTIGVLGTVLALLLAAVWRGYPRENTTARKEVP